jgi:hypothetical protein
VIITSVEKGSGIWHGTAMLDNKNLKWFYSPRRMFDVQEQDERNPRCWMNVDPPHGAKRAVLKAIRAAKGL